MLRYVEGIALDEMKVGDSSIDTAGKGHRIRAQLDACQRFGFQIPSHVRSSTTATNADFQDILALDFHSIGHDMVELNTVNTTAFLDITLLQLDQLTWILRGKSIVNELPVGGMTAARPLPSESNNVVKKESIV